MRLRPAQILLRSSGFNRTLHRASSATESSAMRKESPSPPQPAKAPQPAARAASPDEQRLARPRKGGETGPRAPGGVEMTSTPRIRTAPRPTPPPPTRARLALAGRDAPRSAFPPSAREAAPAWRPRRLPGRAAPIKPRKGGRDQPASSWMSRDDLHTAHTHRSRPDPAAPDPRPPCPRRPRRTPHLLAASPFAESSFPADRPPACLCVSGRSAGDARHAQQAGGLSRCQAPPDAEGQAQDFRVLLVRLPESGGGATFQSAPSTES
jgi:hypothetical protein